MSSLNLGVSVIICCHNSAKRLPETLRHLAAQQVPEGIPWEVIVVDNASTDDTSTVARTCPSSSLPLRVVSESQPGLRHARAKGMREAQHGIISFLDDDNWAAVDWISRVSDLFSAHPEVGISGGRAVGEAEVTPPDWFPSIQGKYAIGPQHAQSGDITDFPGTLLWGAGMNLRRAACVELESMGFESLIEDRKGKELTTGGDTELCFAIRALGWRLWYDDGLVLRHFIPKERLRWDYARRLHTGMGKAAALFDLYLFALQPSAIRAYPRWKQTWLFQFLKVLRQMTATFCCHPLACLTEPEGSLSALKFIACQGQLRMLWKLAEDYAARKASVAAAPWARKFRSKAR